MKKGLAILADPTKVFPGEIQMVDRDTLNQIRDLYNNFFSDKSVTPEAALAQFAEIIKNAPPLYDSKTVTTFRDLKIDPAEMPDRFGVTKPCPECPQR